MAAAAAEPRPVFQGKFVILGSFLVFVYFVK
jgi:hypothetical protein